MEHRNGARMALRLDVELWRCGKKYGTFQSTNIGRGGLFIEQNQAALSKKDRLIEGDCLRLNINTNHFDDAIDCPLNAMVVHKSAKGIGLMWADYKADFFHALDNLLMVAA